MFDSRAAGAVHGRCQREPIVEERRSVVGDCEFRDDQKDAGRFELPVVVSPGAEEFDAPCLKVVDEVCVVHASLAVGFAVADAEGDRMFARRRWGGGHRGGGRPCPGGGGHAKRLEGWFELAWVTRGAGAAGGFGEGARGRRESRRGCRRVPRGEV